MSKHDAGKTANARREKLTLVSLYRKNPVPYGLALLAIFFELFYVVTVLDNMAVGYLMGITVLVNIAVLFTLFVCAVKMNVYSVFWSYAAYVVSAYFVLRGAVILPFVIKPLSRLLMLQVCNGAAAVLLVLAGSFSLSVIQRRRKAIAAREPGEVKS